jgi:hypothetical protein
LKDFELVFVEATSTESTQTIPAPQQGFSCIAAAVANREFNPCARNELARPSSPHLPQTWKAEAQSEPNGFQVDRFIIVAIDGLLF